MTCDHKWLCYVSKPCDVKIVKTYAQDAVPFADKEDKK